MTEKELILTHVLKCRRVDLHLKPLELSLEQQNIVDAILKRRSQGEPLQYILGECEFMGYPLTVDSRVLIPRPETELLVDLIVKQCSQPVQKKVKPLGLDLGTGSGNITVALLKLLPEYRMVSLDISHGALEVARENAVRNNVMDRVHLVQGDVFQWLNAENAFSGQFSLVVSNPPYIKTDDLTRLPQEVKKEPVSALDGWEDGLIFYTHIISNISHMLKPGGWIFFEIGETQGKSLDNLLTRQGSFVNIQVIKDFNQRDRIIKAQLKF